MITNRNRAWNSKINKNQCYRSGPEHASVLTCACLRTTASVKKTVWGFDAMMSQPLGNKRLWEGGTRKSLRSMARSFFSSHLSKEEEEEDGLNSFIIILEAREKIRRCNKGQKICFLIWIRFVSFFFFFFFRNTMIKFDPNCRKIDNH